MNVLHMHNCSLQVEHNYRILHLEASAVCVCVRILHGQLLLLSKRLDGIVIVGVSEVK